MEATPSPSTRLTPSTARRRILGGLSVRVLARRAGLSHSYLGRVLRGQRRPLVETAKMIAQSRGLTLDGFYSLLQVAVKGEEPAKTAGKAGRRRKGRGARR